MNSLRSMIYFRNNESCRSTEAEDLDALRSEVALQPADAGEVRHHALLHEHGVAKEHAVRGVEEHFLLVDAEGVPRKAEDSKDFLS